MANRRGLIEMGGSWNSGKARVECAPPAGNKRPIWSTRDLASKFGVTNTCIHQWSKLPEFPKPVSVVRRGHFKVRSSGYDLQAVMEWMKKYKPEHLSTQST